MFNVRFMNCVIFIFFGGTIKIEKTSLHELNGADIKMGGRM